MSIPIDFTSVWWLLLNRHGIDIAGISTLLRHGAIFNDKSCLLEVLGWTFDLGP